MEEKLLELVNRSKVYHIATVDQNNIPHIRVFSSNAIINSQFCVCMGNQKEVYKQIKNNSNIAISGYIDGYSWWRASAVAVEITSDDSRAQMFKKMPELIKLYQNREDEFSIFALTQLKVESY